MSDDLPLIEGTCDPAFARVRDAFAAGFAAHGELGAALCVFAGGRAVVDVWGGFADVARTRRWRRDTVVNVFSAVKALTAVCAHRLVDDGRLDLEAPVAALWPEFARNGKEAIRVDELLAHRAGLAALHDEVPAGAALRWEPMVAALAAETPWWPPGTAHGYHAITFGWLVGEVVRRAGGTRLREQWRALGGPLADELDVGWHGDGARVAEVAPVRPLFAADDPFVRALADRASLGFRALMTPPELATPGIVNRDDWRRAELPASNGHASARGLGQLYAALVGIAPALPSLLSGAAVARAIAPRSEGPDRVLVHESRFALGFMLPSPLRPFSPNRRAFGHGGAGGSLGFADPDAGVALGYVVNQPLATSLGGDPRWQPIVRALYEAL
jgi:CubicO group peptidase (beta-lactamase class C family)